VIPNPYNQVLVIGAYTIRVGALRSLHTGCPGIPPLSWAATELYLGCD